MQFLNLNKMKNSHMAVLIGYSENVLYRILSEFVERLDTDTWNIIWLFKLILEQY
jgi:hypothetical protein